MGGVESPFIIYGLIDPLTGDVRYIGKSCSGMKRVRRHWTPSESKAETHKNRWIRQLRQAGMRPRVEVIATAKSGDILPTWERVAIAWARALGWPLTNITEGGDGLLGVKRTFTEEWKQKIAATLTGKNQSAETRAKRAKTMRDGGHIEAMAAAKRGKPMSPEHRESIKRALANPEVRAKMRAGARAAQGTAEARKANAERGRRQYENEQARQAARERALTQFSSPEARALMSERAKLRFATPESRAAHAEALRAGHARRRAAAQNSGG